MPFFLINGQMTMTPIYNIRISRCIFGAKLVILAQINYKLLRRQAKFPRIPGQNEENDLWGQGQWPLFSIQSDSILWCIFGANLVIPAQICDELSHRQTKFLGIPNQNSQNDLEGHSRWPLFSIPSESIPWCMFDTNLVIATQICDELSCRQA